MTLSGKRALVTGASSGLGVDFARELAKRGCDLVIAARRLASLEEVATELRGHNVDVRVIASDLSSPGAEQALFEAISSDGRPIDILVNNAGLGLYGEFLDIPMGKEQQMLRVDMLAVVALTKLFLPSMKARKYGRILNIASVAAFQPTPLYATYAAAKAFVLFFSEALGYELRGTGVTVTTLSPGITATEFLQVAGQKATAYQRAVMMTSAQVAKIGIDGMLRGKRSIVPGPINAMMAAGVAFTPRPLVLGLAHRLMKSDPPTH